MLQPAILHIELGLALLKAHGDAESQAWLTNPAVVAAYRDALDTNNQTAVLAHDSYFRWCFNHPPSLESLPFNLLQSLYSPFINPAKDKKVSL